MTHRSSGFSQVGKNVAAIAIGLVLLAALVGPPIAFAMGYSPGWLVISAIAFCLFMAG